MELEVILKEGLAHVSDSGLGDRRQYIGASDVGGCPRKTVLSKLEQPDFDLATLIRFARGHMAEQFLVSGFKQQAKYNWTHQREVAHKSKPFKAHIDFEFNGKNTMAVMEVKTVSSIPSMPYDSWVQQLHFQMGLLRESNPEKTIRGSVFAMDLNSGQWKMFNGFKFNSTIYEGLLHKASKIWDCVKDPSLTPDTEKGPLCAWCHYRPGCPAYDDLSGLPEMPLENELQQYLGLKEHERQLKTESNKLAAMLKSAIASANPDENKIKIGSSLVRLSERSRTNVDTTRLRTEQAALYKKYAQTKSYEVLVIE